MENRFLSITEVSKYLGIKITTLYTKVEQKEVPHYRIGRLIRFKKDEIDFWIKGQKVEPVDIEKKPLKFSKLHANQP